ncbi:pleckstrin homology domain-containing family G member 5 isoform X3 [Nematostella vectensis]|uniref:pleckstrin homology domain-containing family G member 5 isoform X3 n=1 Tax=Nematostella vectensis TaxID=45351 RepID=UPI00207771B0|nr:pleckstrin homology domain-containing family G member 5 isoform X3 [Nematostella vectensis]
MCIIDVYVIACCGREDFDQDEREEGGRLCQGKLCSSSVQIKRSLAVKICHHEVCQENNNGSPLHLCLKCDEVQHLGAKSIHARFDIPELVNSLSRTPSSRSNGSDSGAEEDVDTESTESLKVEKKTRGYSSGKRMFKLSAGTKRKPRRHNTDDPGREFFSLKFFGFGDGENDFEVEVVPALKGKTLKDSLEPFFVGRGISFSTHSVFLDASNTPLPLAFDTFPLGGNVLHVKANDTVNVDQRVIDMVAQFEDSSPSEDYQRPKSASFIRSGSFSTKARNNIKKLEQEERERAAREQLKISQRGKKNIKSFLGDDPSATDQTTPSPMTTSGSYSGSMGTLHRPKSTGKLTGLFNQPKQPKGVMGDMPMRGNTLKDLLDVYTVYGMQNRDPNIKDETDEGAITLEESWTAVVDPEIMETMTKKQKDQQEAIWELLFTEVTYIHKLSIVKKLFILCLRNVQSEGFLLDVEIEKLFSNIEDIYELNYSFWVDCLCEVAEKSRKTGKPLNPMDMNEAFPMFDKRFEPYITYCMEESRCLKYFKEKIIENEDFRTYITWCEEHRLCTNRLKLTDYLVKPMQRLTKYPLLLKAIHKKTQDEEMKEGIWKMILTVESLLSKVDGAMREMCERNKLRSVANRIQDNYTVIEAVNEEMEKILVNYNSLDLMKHIPGMDIPRCVIHEGPLRLVEKQGKMDVHVFLFTDLLLITKPKKADKYRVIKPPMMVDKLYVHASKDPGTFLLVYVNEYNTVVHAFALQGSNADQTQWMDAIRKAQKLLLVAKLGQGTATMGSRLESDSSELLSPSKLVAPGNYIREQRRGSSHSIISMESMDSDDEMGLNESFQPPPIPRYRSETSLSSNSKVVLDRDDRNDGANQPPTRKMSFGERINNKLSKRVSSLTDLHGLGPEIVVDTGTDEIRKIPPVNPDVGRLRADSAPKVARSSSDPPKERPKVDPAAALSRSCSEPRSPPKRRTSSEAFYTEGLPLAPSTSLTSSSAYSTEGLASGSESGSCPSVKASAEAKDCDNNLYSESDSPRREYSDPMRGYPNSSIDNSSEADSSLGSPSRPVGRSVSAPEKRFRVEGEDEVGVDESKSATFPRRSTARVTGSPGLRALQSLSESLEYSLKHAPPTTTTKQAPQIKSPLIAQQKLQSAINSGSNSAEAPRKRTTLPRRSSPVISRKPRPDTLMRSKSDFERFESHRVTEDSRTSSPDAEYSPRESPRESLQQRTPRRSHSEVSRLPVKADRQHYSSLDLSSPETPTSSDFPSPRRESPDSSRRLSPPSGSLDRSRKKSMSLSDLLSIGRDLTRERSENAHRAERLSSDPTDDRNKPERKVSRFRLGRSKSRSELKDGIASGPNIDKRKATRLYLKESLMLESSEDAPRPQSACARTDHKRFQYRTKVQSLGKCWQSLE